MPPPRVWSSRRPLYRVNLVMLLTMTPFNVLGMLFPAWMKTKVMLTWGGKVTDVWLQYGLWRHCSDVAGCRWVHDDVIDVDVGGWMYPINVFMVLSTLCQLCATLLGVIQNFMPTDRTHYIPVRLLRQVFHRDSPSTEDVAFLAGFFGTVACIIFMLSTKDKISEGAHYQWAFAFTFLSSTLTVMASLTLTRSHILPSPSNPNNANNTNNTRRRRRRRSRSNPAGRREQGRRGSSLPRLLRVLRSDDIQLEDNPRHHHHHHHHHHDHQQQGESSQAEASSPAREGGEGARSRFFSSSSSSSSRRRRSRSGSRSRSQERSRDHPRSRRGEHPSSEAAGPSRRGLRRSPELENIPAAVTPSSGQFPGAHRRSRTAPIMCLEMSDLQSRAAPAAGSGDAGATAALGAEGGCAEGATAAAACAGPSPSSRTAVSSLRSGDLSENREPVPSSSRTRDDASASSSSHTGSKQQATQLETVVDLPQQ